VRSRRSRPFPQDEEPEEDVEAAFDPFLFGDEDEVDVPPPGWLGAIGQMAAAVLVVVAVVVLFIGAAAALRRLLP
jgi:hypothetical protein